MNAEIQKEHRWLQKLVGQWAGECECQIPGQPPAKTSGTEVVRSIGGLWTVGEGEGECPMSKSLVQSIMTLGYDPQKQRFVGTFIASMMTHMWHYEGTLDESANRLVLDTQGPDFTGKSGLVRYQDIIEFTDDDHRILRSQVLGENGQWQEFMIGHYERVKTGAGKSRAATQTRESVTA